ncbi:MAG: contact-dependent growth inhibition system immunity protein [Acetobacteraceae bacterium]
MIEAFDSSEWTIGTESKSILDRFSEFKMDWMLPLDSMSRSIEELEGIAWPASSVAQTGHALRRKKLLQLTTADLRLGLEQQIGVDILAPLAAKRLRSDPLVEAQLYPGDLLQCLLEVPSSCWQQSGTAG